MKSLARMRPSCEFVKNNPLTYLHSMMFWDHNGTQCQKTPLYYTTASQALPNDRRQPGQTPYPLLLAFITRIKLMDFQTLTLDQIFQSPPKCHPNSLISPYPFSFHHISKAHLILPLQVSTSPKSNSKIDFIFTSHGYLFLPSTQKSFSLLYLSDLQTKALLSFT